MLPNNFILSICCTLRQNESYVKSFCHSIKSLARQSFSISSINIVHDGKYVSNHDLLDLSQSEKNVIFIPEKRSDLAIQALDEKVKQWSTIGNQALESALGVYSTHILYVEPDLCWPCDIVDELLAYNVDIIAPIIMLGSEFYDSWGFRDLNGNQIRSLSQLLKQASQSSLVQLSSVGSMVLMKKDIISKGVRMRGPYHTGLLVGICHDAAKLGFKTYAATNLTILHPTTIWRKQIWKINEIIIISQDRPPLRLCANIISPGPYKEFVANSLAPHIPALNNIIHKECSYVIQKIDANSVQRLLSVVIAIESYNT